MVYGVRVKRAQIPYVHRNFVHRLNRSSVHRFIEILNSTVHRFIGSSTQPFIGSSVHRNSSLNRSSVHRFIESLDSTVHRFIETWIFLRNASWMKQLGNFAFWNVLLLCFFDWMKTQVGALYCRKTCLVNAVQFPSIASSGVPDQDAHSWTVSRVTQESGRKRGTVRSSGQRMSKL